MPAFSSITPTAPIDGVAYATAVPLTSTEAVLGDALEVPTIIPTTYGEAIVAVVKISLSGFITGNSPYVVMQIDLADGVWVDMCWCFWAGTQGSATFVFSNGIAGANVFQQTRNAGQVPLTSAGAQGNGSNQMTLGGRIRFVGKSAAIGGSSSAAGVDTQVTATIRYKLLGLR